LGVSFTVLPADVDESPLAGELPIPLAQRLAERKAAAVAAKLDRAVSWVIVAADTVVALGDLLLAKPVDDADAARMLTLLRGQSHQVHSAVAVLATATGAAQTRVSSTTVWMREYTDAEIAAYVATGDPHDKAGAYAIQHPTFAPVARLEGCLSGVIGLPLHDLRELLAAAGVIVRGDVVRVCEAQTHFACCRRAD
jgi:septum formation protein